MEAYLNTNVKLFVLVVVINLVQCHIGVSVTFLLEILYSFYLYIISKTCKLYLQSIQHLLNHSL